MTALTLLSSTNPAGFITLGTCSINAVTQLVQRFFSLLQGAFLALFGAKEVLFDADPVPPITLFQKVKSYCLPVFEKMKQLITYPVIHGVLYLGSGISECLASFHRLEWLHLGIAYPIATACSLGLFLLGNMVSLCYNAHLLSLANRLPHTLPDKEKQEVFNVQFSAVCAIISNISYIVWSALICFQGSVIAVIVMACLGLLGGGVKVIFDFLKNPRLPVMLLTKCE